MRYDDRLLTVLNQPADDRHDVAVRWRQLVDLVARAGASHDSPAVSQALAVIRNDAAAVDEPLRAAAARSVAAWPLPFGLLQYFALESLAIAAPVMAAAKLERGDWERLYDDADAEMRAFIASLHPEVAEPARAPQPRIAEDRASAPAPADRYTPPSLQEVVQRIERRREIRAREMAAVTETAIPSIDPRSAFRWECDAGGDIAWVEGAPRGPLIGRSLTRVNEADGKAIDRELSRAFAMRAPFRDAALTVAAGGVVSGEWKVSGVPAFDPADGRFAGYRGVALRDAPPPATMNLAPMPEVLADPAALRELVHEIKTPLNAIIGFAEIIEGQYLGPADRGYRERASEIVEQARLLLTAIEDLDFAAKVHAAASERRPQVDLGQIVRNEADEMRRRAALRDVHLAFSGGRNQAKAMVQPELAERLILRLFDTLVAHSAPKERLQVSVGGEGPAAQLSVSRPERLRDAPELGEAPATRVDENFPFRLLRGLARLAGGDLVARPESFALIFPAA